MNRLAIESTPTVIIIKNQGAISAQSAVRLLYMKYLCYLTP